MRALSLTAYLYVPNSFGAPKQDPKYVERPEPRRLERYLTLAHESGATPVVVLNKADAADDLAARVEDVGFAGFFADD